MAKFIIDFEWEQNVIVAQSLSQMFQFYDMSLY